MQGQYGARLRNFINLLSTLYLRIANENWNELN